MTCRVTILQGGAAFMGMREYEKDQAANGDPPHHEFAKEVSFMLLFVAARRGTGTHGK